MSEIDISSDHLFCGSLVNGGTGVPPLEEWLIDSVILNGIWSHPLYCTICVTLTFASLRGGTVSETLTDVLPLPYIISSPPKTAGWCIVWISDGINKNRHKHKTYFYRISQRKCSIVLFKLYSTSYTTALLLTLLTTHQKQHATTVFQLFCMPRYHLGYTQVFHTVLLLQWLFFFQNMPSLIHNRQSIADRMYPGISTHDS